MIDKGKWLTYHEMLEFYTGAVLLAWLRCWLAKWQTCIQDPNAAMGQVEL